jgi:prevent-host-death family protein
MTTTFGLFEAKNKLSELVERASRGEEIVITRRGQEIARLVAASRPDDGTAAQALVARIRRSRKGHPLGRGVSLSELIAEGRR